MDLLESLNWRYAAKHLNGQPIAPEKIDRILEAIRLSASSVGLQPYRVAVVTDHALKARIHQEACPQPQVVESSHLLVFAAQKDVTEADIDHYMARIAATRDAAPETLTPFADSVKGALLSRTAEQHEAWTARQAYIALGFGLVAAAAEGVDSCAMEGFNPAAMDAILGLEEQGLRSVVVLALGYRDAEKDFLASAKKVRRPAEELFLRW